MMWNNALEIAEQKEIPHESAACRLEAAYGHGPPMQKIIPIPIAGLR